MNNPEEWRDSLRILLEFKRRISDLEKAQGYPIEEEYASMCLEVGKSG